MNVVASIMKICNNNYEEAFKPILPKNIILITIICLLSHYRLLFQLREES